MDLMERTVVRFLYDAENLYVGIYAYDREPDRIVATNRSRDGMLGVEGLFQSGEDSSTNAAQAIDRRITAMESRLAAKQDTLTRKFEAQLIVTALETTRGRRIEAALKLGIGRNTITRKIQELGLDEQ